MERFSQIRRRSPQPQVGVLDNPSICTDARRVEEDRPHRAERMADDRVAPVGDHRTGEGVTEMEVVVVDSKTQAWIHRRPATHLTLHRLQRIHAGCGVDVGRVICGQASEPGQDMIEIDDGVLRPV